MNVASPIQCRGPRWPPPCLLPTKKDHFVSRSPQIADTLWSRKLAMRDAFFTRQTSVDSSTQATHQVNSGIECRIYSSSNPLSVFRFRLRRLNRSFASAPNSGFSRVSQRLSSLTPRYFADTPTRQTLQKMLVAARPAVAVLSCVGACRVVRHAPSFGRSVRLVAAPHGFVRCHAAQPYIPPSSAIVLEAGSQQQTHRPSREGDVTSLLIHL